MNYWQTHNHHRMNGMRHVSHSNRFDRRTPNNNKWQTNEQRTSDRDGETRVNWRLICCDMEVTNYRPNLTCVWASVEIWKWSKNTRIILSMESILLQSSMSHVTKSQHFLFSVWFVLIPSSQARLLLFKLTRFESTVVFFFSSFSNFCFSINLKLLFSNLIVFVLMRLFFWVKSNICIRVWFSLHQNNKNQLETNETKRRALNVMTEWYGKM